MYAYEIFYKEDGFECYRGFKTEKQLNNCVARLQKKANVEIIETLDNVKGITTKW